jgi:hypothetical protein
MAFPECLRRTRPASTLDPHWNQPHYPSVIPHYFATNRLSRIPVSPDRLRSKHYHWSQVGAYRQRSRITSWSRLSRKTFSPTHYRHFARRAFPSTSKNAFSTAHYVITLPTGPGSTSMVHRIAIASWHLSEPNLSRTETALRKTPTHTCLIE